MDQRTLWKHPSWSGYGDQPWQYSVTGSQVLAITNRYDFQNFSFGISEEIIAENCLVQDTTGNCWPSSSILRIFAWRACVSWASWLWFCQKEVEYILNIECFFVGTTQLYQCETWCRSSYWSKYCRREFKSGIQEAEESEQKRMQCSLWHSKMQKESNTTWIVQWVHTIIFCYNMEHEELGLFFWTRRMDLEKYGTSSWFKHATTWDILVWVYLQNGSYQLLKGKRKTDFPSQKPFVHSATPRRYFLSILFINVLNNLYWIIRHNPWDREPSMGIQQSIKIAPSASLL